MAYSHFYNTNTNKYTTLYLFYIKKFNTYKLGVTSNFEKRINKYIDGQPFVNYYVSKEEIEKNKISRNDILVLFCKEVLNAMDEEKKLLRMIIGYKLNLPHIAFKEHFTGDAKANEILEYMNDLN
jgi:hypothetical protein